MRRKQHKSLSPNDFAIRKKNIRINHLISGTWILGAKRRNYSMTDNIQLWGAAAQTVPWRAVDCSSFGDGQFAERQQAALGQNVEQILLNNIYAIIMQSKSADIALNSVTELIGDYFTLTG